MGHEVKIDEYLKSPAYLAWEKKHHNADAKRRENDTERRKKQTERRRNQNARRRKQERRRRADAGILVNGMHSVVDTMVDTTSSFTDSGPLAQMLFVPLMFGF